MRSQLLPSLPTVQDCIVPLDAESIEESLELPQIVCRFDVEADSYQRIQLLLSELKSVASVDRDLVLLLLRHICRLARWSPNREYFWNPKRRDPDEGHARRVRGRGE